MKTEVAFPDYSAESGLRIEWEPEAAVSVTVEQGEVLLQANRAGLVTLARLFLSLTQDGIEDAYHVHLDSSNGLEEGSAELIIGVR